MKFFKMIKKKKNFNIRFNYINNYKFPNNVLNKYKENYKKNQEPDIEETIQDFKLYFLALLIMDLYELNTKILLNNKNAENLWCALILDTNEYESFCYFSIGKFIHHSYGEKYTKEELNELDTMTDFYIQKSMNLYFNNVKPPFLKKLFNLK